MAVEKICRTRIIGLRLSQEEFTILKQRASNTTTPQLSEYIRRALFQKKIITYTRNRSMDDLIAESMLWRTELNAIGNNLNQAVRKLHSIEVNHETARWWLHAETTMAQLSKQLSAIDLHFNKMVDVWLQ